MTFWMKNYPDIITGWNCKFFDIPYLMNRIIRLTAIVSTDTTDGMIALSIDFILSKNRYINLLNITLQLYLYLIL